MSNPQDSRGAALSWREGEIPVSVAFDDAYYAYGDGLAETCEIFINGNRLSSRWKARLADSARSAVAPAFHVAELGFGTGLNFFATVSAWRDMLEEVGANRSSSAGTAEPQPVLRYTSFELSPLRLRDMARAFSPWSEMTDALSAFQREAMHVWPPQPGLTSYVFGQVELRLVVGDASETVAAHLEPTVDAWFLDGFSPAKNPRLWDADLLAAVAAATVSGGTFSTYTAAGWVRRNLTEAGFSVEKVRGYGHKRERLQGFKP